MKSGVAVGGGTVAVGVSVSDGIWVKVAVGLVGVRVGVEESTLRTWAAVGVLACVAGLGEVPLQAIEIVMNITTREMPVTERFIFTSQTALNISDE